MGINRFRIQPPAQMTMFDVPPPSHFNTFIENAMTLVEREPQLLDLIEADLNAHGATKKAARLQDREWAPDTQRVLPDHDMVKPNPECLRLETGRPRMKPKVCYLFCMARAYADGVKSAHARDLLLESRSLQILLAAEEVKMPGLSTIIDNTNAVSQRTREAILDAQIRWILDERLDDFQELTIDSTAVSANTAWPTDSKLIVTLVKRLFHRAGKLDRFELKPMEPGSIPELINDLKKLDFQIANCKKKKGAPQARKELYHELLDTAEIASQIFEDFLKALNLRIERVQVPPTRKEKLIRLFQWMREDLNNLDRIITYCTQRIDEDKGTPSTEKVLSVSDGDAAWIEKGDREPVVGYKPQVCKSGNGFISALVVPFGNASDVTTLEEACERVIERTGIVPKLLSADGGYASKDNRNYALDKGFETVSFSSSKGKALVSPEEWNSPLMKTARRMRSAVESLMFQIKNTVGFGEVVRRGLENVRMELTDKAIAFNFLRMDKVSANC